MPGSRQLRIRQDKGEQVGTESYQVGEETQDAVLGALRKLCDGLTWSGARKLMAARRIGINGVLCIDEGRRVVSGDLIEVREQPFPPVPRDPDVQILYLDRDMVVVNKPSGMLSMRHPGDLSWRQRRKMKQPALEEVLGRLIQHRDRQRRLHAPGELQAVHRIDRDTSGILAFARNERAAERLIEQFASHRPLRRYFCVIPGSLPAQTLRSWQVRDRGDGLRGSGPRSRHAQEMITHIKPVRELRGFTEMECRLETGRTNQIRIQLAEAGHPICGDVRYRGPFGVEPAADSSRAHRMALHAAELGLEHPTTGEQLTWRLRWPPDMLRWMDTLR